MKQTKREHCVILRLAGPLVEQLSAEAARDNRPLADYIRIVLVLHALEVVNARGGALTAHAAADKQTGASQNGAAA